jgi:hypothetical protein
MASGRIIADDDLELPDDKASGPPWSMKETPVKVVATGRQVAA